MQAFFEQILKSLAQLILPLKNDLLFGGMNIDVDKVRPDRESKVHEVGKASLWLEHIVHGVDSFLQLVVLYQAVVDEQ